MAVIDFKANKVSKKAREKRQQNTHELAEIVEIPGSEDSSTADAKQLTKKAQGIVIDGRTYTCATCKTGHRVGICKHARERPMKPTHPPGRPPAGAPKKVVCDCPKNCTCSKKDCKCSRKCNCTQPMYMLVYIPAPEEDEDADEEKGEWKLGEQVTTDLKGNILTPEQVKERQEKKEALKLQPPIESLPKGIIEGRPRDITPPSEKQSNAAPIKSCCNHKRAVAAETIAAQASPQGGTISKSAADGCNCGHLCDCAFCPQHPNNATSMNMARQQAMYFANNPFMNDQSIVPFLPNMAPSMSCMGGQPRFAISRNALRPSFDELQRTFPNPGYVIGYPIWSTRTDSAGYPMAPFPMSSASFTSSMGMPDIHSMHMDTPTPHFSPTHMTPMEQVTEFDFSQDEFGIGNAFVASAGVGGWESDLMSPTMWPTDTPLVSTPFAQMVDLDPFIPPRSTHSSMPTQSIQPSHNLAYSHPIISTEHASQHADLSTIGLESGGPQPPISPAAGRSCCSSSVPRQSAVDDFNFSSEYLSPAIIGSPTSTETQLQFTGLG